MSLLIVFLLLTAGCASGGDNPVAATPQPAPVQQSDPKPIDPPAIAPAPTPEPTPPPAPNTLKLTLSGTFGPDGTITGTFTYVTAQGPMDTNIRHLTPNVAYTLEDWDITVNSASIEEEIASTVYRKANVGNSVEFCIGNCIFSAPALIELSFRNESNQLLQLAFELQDPTPFINPPSSLSEWGPMMLNGASVYRFPCPICSPVAYLGTGALGG